MKNIPTYDEFVNESFWLSTTEYKSSDDNGTSFLNVSGVPGYRPSAFLEPIEAALKKTNGLITKEIAELAKSLANKVNRTKTSLDKDLAFDPADFWLENRRQEGKPYGKFRKSVSGFDYVDAAYSSPGTFWVARWMSLNIGKTLHRDTPNSNFLSY